MFEGIKFDFGKVEVVFKMERFSDVVVVWRLVGLVNYLLKFLSKFLELCELLRWFIYKGVEWNWLIE